MTLDPAEVTQMRSDMTANAFDHRCTIQRSNGSVDPYGHETPTWANHLLSQPCHFWFKEEVEIVGPQINVVVGDAGMTIGATVDVHEGDRISLVTNQLGETIATIHRILSVMARASHKELDLKAENA